MKTHHVNTRVTKGVRVIFQRKLLHVLLMFSLLGLQTITGNAQIISTVAGNGFSGYSTGGGVALAAAIHFPRGVRAVPSGGFILVDGNNHIIRRVTPGGAISDIAGTPTVSGYTGDGGLATSATLYAPCDVAIDNAGNVFIADRLNQVIRRVDVGTGIITTYAGIGTAGYSGDGGLATAARLSQPYGIAFDASDNLFIADFGNSAIRRVDAGTGIITTYAGMGIAGYSGDGGLATAARLNLPAGLRCDASDNLFIADQYNDVVRRVDAGTGIITTYAGIGTTGFSGDGGAATAAQLNRPADVALDASGNLYIADVFNNRVRMVAAGTGVITTYAGTGAIGFSGDGGPATAATFKGPVGLGVDASGNLYIGDQSNMRIRMVTAAPPPPPPPSCSDSCYWKVTGNNIIGGNNKFGTLTADDINFVTNSTARGILTQQGLLGLYGINPPSAPTAYLDVECTNHHPDFSGLSDIRFRNLEHDPAGNLLIINPATGYVFNSNITTNSLPINSCFTLNTVPKFTPSGSLGCSQIYDDGISVGINSTGPFGYIFPGGSTWLTGATLPPMAGMVQLDVNGVTRSLAYIATSDERYKTNISPINDPFKIINAINGKTYFWNDLARKEAHADGSKQYGFIAQQVAESFPEAAVKDQNGNYGLYYNAFIPVLLEGEKQLHSQLKDVLSKNEKLQNQLDELQKKIDMLISCCASNNTGLDPQAPTGGNKLYQNVPNPFGKETEIKYFIHRMNSNAAILVTDLHGREVSRHAIASAGNGSITFKPADTIPGVYLYTLIVDGVSVDTRRMVIGE